MLRRRLPDLLIALLLFVLPLLLFWQQTLGGRTLIPTENLYQFEPYRTYREVVGAPEIPHNHLVSDLVLQNYQWKSFIRATLAQGEIPLWNPHQFAGIPFLAAGQPSTLYPFSLLYYVLDLPAAYGWFTVVQLWLAGLFMFAFLRGLNLGRFAALVGAVTYQLSAFFVISAVFPMIIASAAWLPLLLLSIEYTIRRQPFFAGKPTTIPWVILGALALGCNVLAGHVEITYYTLLIAAYYAAGRLLWEVWQARHDLRGALLSLFARGLWLYVLVALGLALGAVQFVPLFELVSRNFRDGSASFQQVLDWAHPARDAIQFVLPNFYGSPAHHSYFDVFSGQTLPVTVNAAGNPITHTEWGMKNYVEAALYVGILPLVLTLYGLIDAWVIRRRRDAEPTPPQKSPPYRVLFLVLLVLALTFMFGLPSYALLYYTLPGINQLHSPFRWIFAVTLCVAVLAAFGAEGLTQRQAALARWFGVGLTLFGGIILIALAGSYLLFDQIEPLIAQVFMALAKAPDAFPDARAFYSYQVPNVLVLGVMLLASGVVFWRIFDTQAHRHIGVFQAFAVGLIAVDLMIASWGFNPASDPALLDFTPPSVEWLQGQPGHWRYTVLDNGSGLFNANMTWRYGLDDIRGYESVITRQYVDFISQLSIQNQLEYNRIAPLWEDRPDALESPLLNLLNVRYLVTTRFYQMTDTERWSLAYEDEAVRIWENANVLPRAYLVDQAALDAPEQVIPVEITLDTGREKELAVTLDAPAWLVVSESYFPGWRAYIRPQGAGQDAERPLDVQLVQGNFQGVQLTEAGEWTLRLVYSPASFQIGAFVSGMALALILFLGGVSTWRGMIGESESEGVERIARNSVAPILLNLFNRMIDFALAAVVLRLLGPEQAGLYNYVIVVFMWFDIFTNFGLNLYLMREVSRERERAAYYFANTSALRFVLIVIGIGLLAGFLFARQNTPGVAPLDGSAILAVGLLYVGLLPGSLSTGFTSLFYAFERAEYPAAVTTVTTLVKAGAQVGALALGFGFVGLAAASLLANVVTLVILWARGRTLLMPATLTTPPLHVMEREQGGEVVRLDIGLMRRMISASFPLMLNHLLATVFFQIDVVILQPLVGSRVVGTYSTAYKWLNAINVIPAFFTQALLPVMSRQAQEDQAAFRRTFTLAIKLLSALSFPAAVFFTLLAEPLTVLLGGREYLPDGAIALQIMIWSVPIGWINSYTQYALIALDLQNRITRAFAIAVTFNIIANLVFIPQFSYVASAVITIFSELLLLIPFALLLQGAVGRLPWLEMLWRPALAAGVMLLIGLVLAPFSTLLAAVAASLSYGVTLLLLRPFGAEEWSRLSPLLPGRVRALAERALVARA